MTARVALAVVAVVVLAWLGVMTRDRRLLDRGTAYTSRPSPANAARAERDLRDARLLNPDERPDQLRALLYGATGHARRGVRLALAVAHREPDSLLAWNQVLVLAGPAGDRAAARLALRELTRLDPLDARRARAR